MKDGGPAFPSRMWGQSHSDGLKHEGMTLRDYFAAAAMQGMVVADAERRYSDKVITEDAYRMADAMIEAREATE